jgi:hypothetical protein
VAFWAALASPSTSLSFSSSGVSSAIVSAASRPAAATAIGLPATGQAFLNLAYHAAALLAAGELSYSLYQ